MTAYTAPLRDLDFVLHDLLQCDQDPDPALRLDRETSGAVLAAAASLAQDILAPLNAVGDREGCKLVQGQVRTAPGFREAYQALCAGGWPGLDADAQFGGQGLPYVLASAVGEIFSAANMALHMYSGLSHAAYSTIRAHGSREQQALYLPHLVSGRWTGTMNLTEPHCGTDLGLLRCHAEPAADGSHYLLRGQKIFISAGDHDLAENIVHLVLARSPGGGAGTRGLSLFIVPKFLPGPDGQPGPANALAPGKVEDKLGLHGNATCVMHYDGAKGFLLGQRHQGLAAMFTMMNEARLGVGLQGYAQAEAAYQRAAAYARERRQGRALPHPQDPDLPADRLIVHPDVRRMLLEQKSLVEGARALVLWVAQLIDRARSAPPSAPPDAAGGAAPDATGADGALIALLTPVIKAFLSDQGFASTVEAQQIFGGHGYIAETGMSQYLRDARITMIYEGANGIQALDLVGRKLLVGGGGAARDFVAQLHALRAQAAADPALAAGFARPLATAIADLETGLACLMGAAQARPEAALAIARDVLHLFGHLAMALVWTRMALTAQARLASASNQPPGQGLGARFYQAKIATGRHYMACQLPQTRALASRIIAGADPIMALPLEDF